MKMMLLTILFILLNPLTQISAAENKSRYYDTQEIKVYIEQYDYEAIVYRPKLQKIKAILVISPTIGNYDSIEGSNAQFFAKNGYAVIVPYPIPTELQKPRPDMNQLDSDYYRPVVSAIGFINLVEAKFNLPSTIPVFVMGSSQGGITSVLLASHIPRIKAAWVAVAGGNLPHIYAHSNVTAIVKFRKNHMATLGMTDPYEYEKFLKSWLKNDPAVSCKEMKIPFHQTIALNDISVPTVTQELLAKECPPHQILRLNLSHSGGTLTIVTMRERIKEFFEKYMH